MMFESPTTFTGFITNQTNHGISTEDSLNMQQFSDVLLGVNTVQENVAYLEFKARTLFLLIQRQIKEL